ncbi:hypothetical protein GUITHDRAFT_149798 [Guillardia theta CCMP2712]|uniref:Dehydrogenase/reductase SDR family member 4 n=2 Tax=Guillardia theta TaxID=55529 RepID=L1K4Q2_GUITC|nr:hypothetical protein GUITHDRAFT_149798 [Guillardia theta CCMP2712]EKX55445.1 hypothetical protein GUITHDRAFT_149798 [Guillardia theta CCMP2712]|eukprot:XP_005842425.1 hypothetical protein GUITHDRAFT_149798 [Guillardia theta CCMP2712]
MQRLAGKVAIVTASTAGIGLGIARRLAQEGAGVMICSRKLENVQKTVDMLRSENLKVEGIPCHVGKAEDRENLIKATLDKFGGRIDALVSNAAVNPAYGPLQEMSESQWEKIFDINVKSAFLLSKEVIPVMQQQKSGSIVMVSSIAAYTAIEGLGAYSISKTALLGLSKVIAHEQAQYGIRCNCIAPGIVKTHFSEALWTDQKVHDKVVRQVPLRRFGEAEDIAGAAAFLCSADSSYMTGETMVIAGGMLPAKI